MKLIVTGIFGRLGRAVAIEAVSRGWTVVGIDHIPCPADVIFPGEVKCILGSFEDFKLLDQTMKGASHLIHTSGLHGGDLTTRTLSEFIRSNVENVARLIELSLGNGIRNICLSSTMEILIGRNWSSSGCTVLDENSPIQTDSPYSLSRALQERLAGEMARQRNVSITLLRYVAFGYCEDSKLGASLLARRTTPRDAARAALQAVATDRLNGEVFNIGPRTPLTNSDIAIALKDPRQVLEKYYPGAAGILEKQGLQFSSDDFWPVTRIEKARRLINWEPEFTFETWLKTYGWEPPPQS